MSNVRKEEAFCVEESSSKDFSSLDDEESAQEDKNALLGGRR